MGERTGRCERIRREDGNPIPDLRLDTGSRVAVIGGGPSGSFSGYFLLTMASRLGVEPRVDIFEPKDYNTPGPSGCNMCGGIVSESLVQMLTVEGIAWDRGRPRVTTKGGREVRLATLGERIRELDGELARLTHQTA